MMNSKQILSTGRLTVAALSKGTYAIDVTFQNGYFVCNGISIASTFGGNNLHFFDIVLSGSNDRLSKNPLSVYGYINTSGAYQDAGGYFRKNGRPMFMVKGGEKIMVTFYNNETVNTIYPSAVFTGYYVDGSGRAITDIPNIPASVLAKY